MTQNATEQSALHGAAMDHHRAGRLDAAERGYQQILAQDGQNPDALHLLGLIAHQRGQHAKAVELINRAIELDPNMPAFFSNLGEAYRELGDAENAVRCARTALSMQPENLGTLNNLALALKAQGKLRESVEQFERLIRVRPDDALAHVHLGTVHHMMGDTPLAIEHLRYALAIRPKTPEVCIRLAHLLVETGEFEEAAEFFRRGYEQGGDRAAAYIQLANVLKGRLPDRDMAVIDQMLADPDVEPLKRANLLFAVAHVHDGRREYAKAADCAQRANAIRKALWEQSEDGYRPDAHEKLVDRLIDGFSPEFFARVRGFGSASTRPVFIVGLPRSGTSLTEQVLASHPQVFGAGELKLIADLFHLLPKVVGKNAPPAECIGELDQYTIARLSQAFLNSLAQLNSAATRVVDKLPDNYLHLGLIAALFPHAKVIHCRRDLRDVAVSCWITGFAEIRWANDFDHIASRFGEYRRIMEHWRRVLPIPILEIDYEETVSDLESVARRMVDRVGLDWDPACLEFHKSDRPVRTASATQIREPIHNRAVARWKRYQDALGPLFERLPSD